jgi:hypothetical protein
MDHRDRTPILIAIGVLLLLVGAVAAFFGPLEMYCFYLFSEGGRFHYEGFGFGSFMFGNIAAQIVGYYLIAMVCIPLGYGHLKKLRWARTLSLISLGFWLVAGVPLMVVFLFVLFTAKELSIPVALMVLAALALSYPALPAVLIWFYRTRDVKLTFETRDSRSYWIETVPQAVLVVCAVCLLCIVVLHLLVLFNGLFPLFGILLNDIGGILLIDLSILWLACLIWGLLRLKRWAWWGALVYFGLLASSTILTLSMSSLSDILSATRFPPFEMQILSNIPLAGIHFAPLVGIPLLITLGLIAFSRRYFKGRGQLLP